MAIIRKLLKWILILFGALVLTFISVGLTDWPFWTAAPFFVVYLTIILLVIHFVRKKIYQHKTGFVQLEKGNRDQANDLWKSLQAVHRQLGHVENPQIRKGFYQKPWILYFNVDNDDLSHALEPYQQLAENKANAEEGFGAYWTVADNVVMMRPEQALLENSRRGEWLKFLENIKAHRHNVPFNKIVISLSISALCSEHGLQDLTTKITSIKNRIAQIFYASGYSIPITLVLPGLENIPGYAELTQSLTLEQRQQVFGLYATEDDKHFSKTVLSNILGRLNGFLDTHFQHGDHENMERVYAFCARLEAVQKNWEQLNTLVFGGASANDSVLSGVFLFGKNDKGYYDFTYDLLTSVIEKQNIAPELTMQGLERIVRRKSILFYSVYAVFALLVLYTIYSFVATSRNLVSLIRAVPPKIHYSENFSRNLVEIDNYNTLMRNIIEFRRRWTIRVVPFHLGLNKIEEVYSKQYVKQFHENIMVLFDRHLEEFLHENSDKLTPLQRAYVVENIVSRVNLIQAKLENRSYEAIMGIDNPELEHLDFAKLPNTILNNFGPLYKTYILWQTDLPALQDEEAKLKKWITEYKLLSNQESMDWLVAWVNEQADVPQSNLQSFWRGSSSIENVQVEKAFNYRGTQQLMKLMNEVNKALPGFLNLNYQEEIFKAWYNTERVNAWYTFVLYFHRGIETLNYKTEWDALYNPSVMLSVKGPYYHLLDSLMDEFGDASISDLPPWLAQVKHFYSLLDFQVKHKKIDNFKNVASVTRNFINTITEKPSVARQRKTLGGVYNKDFNTNLKAANAFVQYQVDLNDLYTTNLGSYGKSYKAMFSVYDATITENTTGDAKKVAKTYDSYALMRKLLGSRHSDDGVFWSIVRGPLDYYIDYNNRNASCHVQQEWVDKVLKPSSGLSGDELTKTLFSNNGLAWNFLSKVIQPFLEVKENVYVPRVIYGHIFPFNDEFYNFINRGLTIQTINREEAQFENYFNKNGGRLITVNSYPTNVNNDAKMLPYKTILRTVCEKKTVEIKNFNFPINQTFKWNLGECGPASISIYFKAMTLTKSYPGQFGFAEFIKDFAQGEPTFTAEDFPQQLKLLKAYNVKTITPSYQISGVESMLHKLDQFFGLQHRLQENELKYLHKGTLPQKITLCWDNGFGQKVYSSETAILTKSIVGSQGKEKKYHLSK